MTPADLVVSGLVALVCGLVGWWRDPQRSSAGFTLALVTGGAGALLGGLVARAIGAAELMPLRIGGWTVPVLGPLVGAVLAVLGVARLRVAFQGSAPRSGAFGGIARVLFRTDRLGAGPGLDGDPRLAQWLRFEGEARRRWGRLTDADMRLSGRSLPKLAARIRERHGDALETVTEQLKQLMLRFRERPVAGRS